MFKLEFATDNAAFGESDYESRGEINRILREVAHRVAMHGETAGLIVDVNGNGIGKFGLESE